MENPKPKVKQLRSSEGEFLETAAPVAAEPSGLETDPLFTVSSVASANDCTGIAVTAPLTETEAESLDRLDNNPVPTDAKSGK